MRHTAQPERYPIRLFRMPRHRAGPAVPLGIGACFLAMVVVLVVAKL